LGAIGALASRVSADRVGNPAFSVAAQLENHAITTSGRFIIELSDSSAGGKFRKRDGTIDTDDIVASVEAATNTTAEPALTFDSGIFQGLSVQLASGNDAASTAAIEAIPGVAHAWPAALFTIPVTVRGELELGDDGLPLWTPHDVTGVSKAHADGNFGQGVTVAIVDSGIDFNHPALGGGFGPGYKVAGGYDFVGDDYDPVLGTEPVPGGEPMDCGGHGTHVAGTVASTHEFNLGVAPNATLKAYKVFGCAGRASEDIVIAGLLRAFEESPDIISASLGSIQGFPYTPSSIVVSRLQAAGVFVSVAAGNSGLDGESDSDAVAEGSNGSEMLILFPSGGPFLTSDLANGFDVTSVGSVAHGKVAAYVAKATASDGTTRDIVSLPVV
jgi:subtilisin family serine protease